MVEAELLAQVCANPEDDAPRRALAAHWRAAGDPRGEFVDVQLRLADLPRWHPDRPALLERQQALLREHGDRWREALPRGGVAVRFHRGFVSGVEGSPEDLCAALPPLVAVAPVQKVELAVDEEEHGPNAAIPELACLSAWRGIQKLGLSDGVLLPDSLRALLGSEALAGVRAIELGDAMCEEPSMQALAALPAPAALRVLDLQGHIGGIGHAGLLTLLAAPWLPQLAELRLYGQELTDDSLLALAGSALRVRHLGLASVGYADNVFTAEALRKVCGSPVLQRLESISLVGTSVGEALPELFAACRGLRSAWIGRTGLDGDDLRLLVRGVSFDGFDELSLQSNPIGDLGARMLAMCHRLPRVLVLAGCGIGPAGLRELAAPSVPSVDALDLRSNPLPPECWQELVAAGRLPKTTALMVDAKGWPEDLVATVRAHYARADLIGAAT